MTETYLWLAITCLAAIASFWAVFHNLHKARCIEDTPTSKIRSAAQGYTELSGFAKSHDEFALIAPLTQKPCLWYRYTIERYQRSGKSSHWRTIEKKTSQTIVSLDDNTGLCFIYPNKADITTKWRDQWQGHSQQPTTPPASGISSLFSGRYRYTEWRIQNDDYLYALGMFQTTRGPSIEALSKTKMADILSEWKRDYDSLLARFDSDNNGALDMQEWERARQAAAKQAHKDVLQNHDDTPVHVMVPPPGQKPYLLANKDPKQLVSKYKWISLGYGLLCLALSALAASIAIRVINGNGL